MPHTMQIRAKRAASLTGDTVLLHAFQIEGNTVTKFALSAEPETATVGTPESEVAECASLAMDDAQRLADDLWDCGIRPKQRPDASLLLQAKDAHIADLREVAMTALRRG
jgi:hypothetical protein